MNLEIDTLICNQHLSHPSSLRSDLLFLIKEKRSLYPSCLSASPPHSHERKAGAALLNRTHKHRITLGKL